MRLLALLLFLSSCATLETGSLTASGEIYKKDLRFTINGEVHEGLAVVPGASSYSISIRPDKPFDLFTAMSCHREISADQVTIERRNGWFSASNKTSIRFSYTPRRGIETDTYCGLEMGIFDKDNGQEYWAFIDFTSDMTWDIPATVYCNGEVISASNSSLCQSRVGLKQKIVFREPVVAVSDCGVFDNETGREFEYYMPLGDCLTVFAIHDRYFRLTTFGYNRIKIKDYGLD